MGLGNLFDLWGFMLGSHNRESLNTRILEYWLPHQSYGNYTKYTRRMGSIGDDPALGIATERCELLHSCLGGLGFLGVAFQKWVLFAWV